MKATKIISFLALTLGLLSTQCAIAQRVVVKVNPRSHHIAYIAPLPLYVIPRKVYVGPRPIVYIYAPRAVPVRRVYITR